MAFPKGPTSFPSINPCWGTEAQQETFYIHVVTTGYISRCSIAWLCCHDTVTGHRQGWRKTPRGWLCSCDAHRDVRLHAAHLCFQGWHWLDSSWQTYCNFFYEQRVIELVVSRYFSLKMSGSKFIQFFTIGGRIGHTVFEKFRQNKILWLIFLLTFTFWCHFKHYINMYLVKLVVLAILSVLFSVIKGRRIVVQPSPCPSQNISNFPKINSVPSSSLPSPWQPTYSVSLTLVTLGISYKGR